MKTWRRNCLMPVFILTLACTVYSSESNVTEDVEPKYFRDYLRLVLVQPIIIQDILKLTADGCVWEDELIWNGSPGEASLSKKQLWTTFSVKFTTDSGADFWKSYSFSSKEGSLELEVIDTTNASNVLKCSE